mmetsp:Transcript_677/g.411  ORF Transcript_677/g.411 Transcript_677/m.411 type:complete len:105 (-) Transcript_677:42-356(-)
MFSHNLARFSMTSILNENETMELVEGKVNEVLKSSPKFDPAKLKRTATFEEMGFDSLDTVELIIEMEKHFGFDIDNQDADKMESVLDAISVFHDQLIKRRSLTK